MAYYRVVVREHTRQTLLVEAENDDAVRMGDWLECDSENVDAVESMVVESFTETDEWWKPKEAS